MRFGTLICAAALLGIAGTASAQTGGGADTPLENLDVDALWERYDAQATQFETLNAECEAGDRATTRVNRICREAADTSLALADTIELILERDDALGPEERELLLDGLLTNRQIAGALWVDLGECAAGREVLVDLIDHPGLDARPVVLQATETWIARADACLAPPPVAETVPPSGGGASGGGDRPSLVGPIVVLATGAAVLIGGVSWDLAMGGTRSDFRALRDECETGCTTDDYETLVGLRDDIDKAGTPIAIMYGAGAAIAAGGAVWLAVAAKRGRADSERVQLMPVLALDRVGATVNVRF